MWVRAAEIGLPVLSGLNSTIDMESIDKGSDMAKAKVEK